MLQFISYGKSKALSIKPEVYVRAFKGYPLNIIYALKIFQYLGKDIVRVTLPFKYTEYPESKVCMPCSVKCQIPFVKIRKKFPKFLRDILQVISENEHASLSLIFIRILVFQWLRENAMIHAESS